MSVVMKVASHARIELRCLFLSAALAVGFSPLTSIAGENVSEVPPPVAFVGELVGIKELNYDCGKDCWDFDSGYEMKYRVIREVSGAVSETVVSFDYFGHNGLTQFAFYPYALIFMYRMDDENLMARYMAVPVWPTIDGDWGYCGDPYWNDIPRQARKFRRLKFASPVTFSSITTKWRDDDYLWFVGKMQPGRKHCWHGAVAEDMVSAMLPVATPGYRRVFQFAPESK